MELMTAFAAAALACQLTARAEGLAGPVVDGETKEVTTGEPARTSFAMYKDGSSCMIQDTVDIRRIVFQTADGTYLTGVMQKYPEGYKGKKDPLYPAGYKQAQKARR